jgi:hypothetical protein
MAAATSRQGSMNKTQLHAYGQLALAIARHAFEKAEADDAKIRHGRPEVRNARRPIFYHDCTSAFERAAQDLVRLGILRDFCADSWLQHNYFVFACDIDQADAVAVRNWRDGPPFDDLLVTFLMLFGFYGSAYWGVSAEPKLPFGTDSRVESTLSSLGSLNYLVKTSSGYVWSERVRPQMQQAGYWQDDDAAPVMH